MGRKELIYGFLQSLPLLIFAKIDFNETSLKNCTDFDLSFMEEFASTFDTEYDWRNHSDYFADRGDSLRPFGSFKTDWARLKLLRDGLPEDSLVKKKFDRLIRLLMVAHEEASESRPSSGYDESTGIFTTVPYSIEIHDKSTRNNVAHDKSTEREGSSISEENDKAEVLQTSSTVSKFNSTTSDVVHVISSSSTSIPVIIMNSSTSYAEDETRAAKNIDDLSIFNYEEQSTVVPNSALKADNVFFNEENESTATSIFDEAIIRKPIQEIASPLSYELASKTLAIASPNIVENETISTDEESLESVNFISSNFTSETPAITEEEFQQPSIHIDSNKKLTSVSIGDAKNDSWFSSITKIDPEQSVTPRDNRSTAIPMNAIVQTPYSIIAPNDTSSTPPKLDVGETSREYFFTAEEYSSTPSLINNLTMPNISPIVKKKFPLTRVSINSDEDSALKMFSNNSNAQIHIEKSNENIPQNQQKAENTSGMEFSNSEEYSSAATFMKNPLTRVQSFITTAREPLVTQETEALIYSSTLREDKTSQPLTIVSDSIIMENAENLSTPTETTGKLENTESSTGTDAELESMNHDEVVFNETQIQSTSEINHNFSHSASTSSNEEISAIPPKIEQNDEMKTPNYTDRLEILENMDSVNETNFSAASLEASAASADVIDRSEVIDGSKGITVTDKSTEYLSSLSEVDANTPTKLDFEEVPISTITTVEKSSKNTTEGWKEKPVAKILKSINSSNSTEAITEDNEKLSATNNMKSSYEETPTTKRLSIEKNALYFDQSKYNQISRDYKHSIEDFGVKKNNSNAGQNFAYELDIDEKNQSIWRQQLDKQSPSAMRLGAFDKDIKPIEPSFAHNKNEKSSGTTEIFVGITTTNDSKDWPFHGRMNKLRTRKRGTLNRDIEKQLIWFYRRGQTEERAKSRSKEKGTKIKVHCKNRRRH